MKAPKLTCKITGNSRVTSENYLNDKAKRLGKTVTWLMDNYISKTVCSQLRKGIPLSKLTDKNISDEELTTLVRNNSKCTDDFTFVNGVYTPSKSTKVEKTPKEKKWANKKAPTIVESKIETLEEVVDEIVSNITPEPEEEPSSEEVLEEINNFQNPF